MKQKQERLHDASPDPIEKAAQLLEKPLPKTEPELSKEIARRSERVSEMLDRYADHAFVLR
jgi:nitrogen-specific signal transduction histidine kinase